MPASVTRLVATALTVGLCLWPDPSGARERPPAVRDLHYGEALFHFYTDDWFASINALNTAALQGRLPNHGDDADLLLGGLYLSYGLKDEAGSLFERLLDQHPDPATRDRAWYYLAKISFQRGDASGARRALERVTGALDQDLEPQRQLLAANVLMALGEYRLAATVLDDWKAPRPWRDYARVNLGTALIKAGAFDAGARLLDQVGSGRARDDEAMGLKDKANVALAFALLAREEAAPAVPVLERVRLEGPFSNQALLGLGWARAADGDYAAALTPWGELGQRNPLDSAVQESLLAVPYAFSQLGARQRAMDTYAAAIDIYQSEIDRLDQAVRDIRGGSLTRLLDGAADGMAGWFWAMEDISEAPEQRYLYTLMARHDFQEALKDWRDLHFLSANLADWSANVAVYQTMIANRRARFDEQLAAARDNPRSGQLAALSMRRDQLRARLATVTAAGDARALADDTQQAQLTRLDRVDARLDLLAPHRDVTAQRKQAQLLRGLVEWELVQQYRPRLWAVEKKLREVEQELLAAVARDQALAGAMATEPGRLDALAARVAAIAPRIAAIERRANRALDAQGEQLAGLAADALVTQQARLRAYLTETRFALATLHDQAAGGLADAGVEP